MSSIEQAVLEEFSAANLYFLSLSVKDAEETASNLDVPPDRVFLHPNFGDQRVRKRL